MPHQIRKNVFETNSSSSHSLTTSPGDLVRAPFTARQLRDGVVELHVGEYGWEWRRYYSAHNKLCYLLTQVTDGEVEGADAQQATQELLRDNPYAAMLARVVREHTGCDILVNPGNGYIDHQSSAHGMALFEDEARLRDFLFGAHSYIQTGNDNSPLPWEIETDRGPEVAYAHSVREPAPGAVTIKLTPSENRQRGSFTTSSGVLLCGFHNEQAYAKLLQEAVLSRVELLETGAYDANDAQNVVKGRMAQEFGRHDGAQDGGLWLSPRFEADYKHERAKDYGRKYTLWVQVPKALSSQLKGLPKTAPTLVELAHARTQLFQLLDKRLGQEGTDLPDYLFNARVELEQRLSALQEKALKEGLL